MGPAQLPSTRRIGRFEIQAEIGRGGFGRVYRAFDPKVGRVVAIKVLDSNGDDSHLGRFRNEASAAGNLHHENIVTVHEFGEDNGIQYLVMAYLEGQDLQKVLKEEQAGRRKPLSVLERVNIMSQVAEGLHYAHRSGVLHRDVKPANIMLQANGGVKIMDFGIARLTRDNSTRLTQQGFLIGTVLYMAPELLQGAEVDALCDIWSYGVIYYEVLAGRNPFETGNLHSEMYKIAHEDPAPLASERCPGSLQPVIQRLLAKDRELRYQSLEDVLFDTEPILLELRKLEAEQLLPQAQALCAREGWEEAQGLVRTILDLEPQNREARVLRERIQREMHRRAVKPKVEALVRRANEEIGRRRFTEAIEIFESARKLDSNDEEVKSLLQQLRAAKERNDRAEKLLAGAQQELLQNRLTSALERASEALTADPEHPQAKELVGRVQLEINERAREKGVQAALLKARGLMAIESFDEVDALLTELNSANPGRSEIQNLMARTLAQRTERDRRLRLKDGLESAKAFLKTGALDDSNRVLEDLARDFPSDAELTDLLAYVRQEQETRKRTAAIDSVSTRVASLVQSQCFQEALGLIQEHLKIYPDEMALSRLMRSVVAGQQVYQKERGLQAGLQRVHDLRQQGASEEAAQSVRALLADYPGDPGLLTHESQIREELRTQQRDAELLRTAQNARKLIGENRAAEAVELLRAALRTYPNDPRLEIVLKRAAESAQDLENAKFVTSQLSDAAEAERRQDWAAALASIGKAQERFPDRAEIAEAERRIRAAMAAAERAGKIAEEESSVTRELSIGSWTAAFARIQSARATYSDPALFSMLLEEGQHRRREEIAGLAAEARRKIIDGQLAEAENFLRTRLEEYSDEPAVRAVSDELQFEKLRRDEAKRREQEKKTFINAQLAVLAEQERTQNWPAALETVRSALQRYPNSAELMAARQRIQSAFELEEHNRRIAAEVEIVQRMLADGDWQGAIARVEEVNVHDPDDPAYLRLWVEAHRLKVKELNAIVAQGRQMFSSGDLEGAIALLRGRLLPFAHEEEFSALLDEVSSECVRREEALRRGEEQQEIISRELDRSAALEARGDYSSAIEVIRGALRQFPEDNLLQEELQRLVSAALKLERDRKTASLAKAIRGEIEDGKWDSALAQIQKAEAEFPGELVFAELRQLAQDKRQSAIEGLIARARGDLAAGEIGSAELLVRKLEPYAHEPPIAALAQDVATARFVRDRGAFARQQIAARRFTEASRAIEEIAGRAPESASIRELQSALEQERQREQKESAYKEGLGEAQLFVRASQYDEAIQRYTSLLVEFPNDAQLEKGLQSAKKTQEGARKKRFAAEIARLKNLRRQGAMDEVRSAAIALLSEQENAEARDLLRWAEAPMAALTPTATAKPKIPQWVPIGVACLSAIAVGGGVFHFLRPHPLTVDSSSLVFKYVGAAVPPQSLSLTGGTRPPQVSSNAKWLSASLETPAKVDVRVDPAGLNAGDYSGQLTLVAGQRTSERQVVTVALTIERQEANPQPRAPQIPSIRVLPASISFPSYQIGNPTPSPQTILVSSENPSTGVELSVERLNSCSWLKLSATNGVTPWELTSMVNVIGLQGARTYICTLAVHGKSSTAPIIVNASLSVIAPAAPVTQPSSLSTSTSSLSFGTYQLGGGAAPSPKTLNVTSANPGTGLAYTTTSDGACNWLNLSEASGVTTGQLSASINTAGLSVGSYSCAIRIAPKSSGVAPPPLVIASLNVVAPKPKEPECIPETEDLSKYNGERHGVMRWIYTGELAAKVSIKGKSATSGQVQGFLPHVRAHFEIPEGVKIVQEPSNCNDWQLVFENPKALPTVEFRWQVY